MANERIEGTPRRLTKNPHSTWVCCNVKLEPLAYLMCGVDDPGDRFPEGFELKLALLEAAIDQLSAWGQDLRATWKHRPQDAEKQLDLIFKDFEIVDLWEE